MSFAEELAKLANLGILDHDGSLLGFRGNHIVNRQARGGGNSNCRWAGILIVADHGHPTATQDSLLAAGPALPGGIRTRRVSMKGFGVRVSSSRAYLTQGHC